MKLSNIYRTSLACLTLAIASLGAQNLSAQEAIPAATAPATNTASAPPETTSTPTTEATKPVTPADAAAPEASNVALLNPIDAPPAGKGQVVFFRPARLTGMAVSFSVREGDTGIGKLTNGTYFVHVSDPGTKEYNISSETRDTLRLEIEEGETYYVIQTIGMGVLMARPNLTPSTAQEFQNKKLKVTKATATDRH